MKSSRRKFLNTAAMTAAGVALTPWESLAGSVLETRAAPKHKGLLFDASDIPRIRETIKHPRFAPYWKSIIDANLEADTRFLRTELRLNNHVVDFARARQILERSSFVYRITGNKSHLEVARFAIDRIL